MINIIPLALAALIALAVFTMGCLYLTKPELVTASFGLQLPSPDPATRAWLRLKGIRDAASGLIVLTMLFTQTHHLLGVVLLVYSIIPFGDMVIVLTSSGSTSKAFSIHGLTCAVMLIAGFLLVHSI